MRQNKYYFSVLLISLLLCYCSEISEVEDNPKIIIDNGIPDSIIFKANNFLISKVGEQFFNSYIKFDSVISGYSPADSFCIEHPENCLEFLLEPHYSFVYSFKIPEKDFVDEIIEFVTDTIGNIVPSREAYGIPKCTNNNCWEHFPLIEKEEAIIIAQNNGLEEGIVDWIISFHFYGGEFDNYVWSVSNTLYRSSYEWGGKNLLIDANNGIVIQTSNWTIRP